LICSADSTSSTDDLSTLKEGAILDTADYTNSILDQITVLAKAVCANETTDEDFAQMETLLSVGNATIEGYAKKIATAIMTRI
jgi:hypothetical protein